MMQILGMKKNDPKRESMVWQLFPSHCSHAHNWGSLDSLGRLVFFCNYRITSFSYNPCPGLCSPFLDGSGGWHAGSRLLTFFLPLLPITEKYLKSRVLYLS